MTVAEAIDLLKSIVKGSCIPGQNHLAMDLVSVHDRPKFDQAFEVLAQAIKENEITRDEAHAQIGIP